MSPHGSPRSASRRIALASLAVAAVVTTALVDGRPDGRSFGGGTASPPRAAAMPATPSSPLIQPSPSISPNTPEPVGRVYEDLFAGFRLSLPSGWVRYRSGFRTADDLAPSIPLLESYPEGKSPTHPSFTMWVLTDRTRSVDDLIGELRQYGARGSWEESSRSLGGRRARTLINRQPEPAATGECACVASFTYVAWSSEIAITIMARADSRTTFDRYRGELEAVESSLSTGRVDSKTQFLRAFLQDRIAGRGAERWLTPKTVEAYRMFGLYVADPCEWGIRVEDYNVEATRPAGPTTIFDVIIWGHSPDGELGGQGERIVIGPGTDRSGARKPALVLDMSRTGTPHTS